MVKLTVDNSLAVLRPDLAAEWDYERNGDLRPEDVTPGSGKQAWWVCKKAKHSWEAKIADRSKGRGCPECSGQRVGADNSLAVLRPDLAAEWDYERNGDLRPEDVTPGSGKQAWWVCKAKHSWEAQINNRSKGSGCPYVHLDRSLAVLRPDLAAEWDYERNGGLRPEDVTPGSNKKAWWVCKAKHSWEARISNRPKGSGCPVCQPAWTTAKLINFAEAFQNNLDSCTQPMAYEIFRAAGIFASTQRELAMQGIQQKNLKSITDLGKSGDPDGHTDIGTGGCGWEMPEGSGDNARTNGPIGLGGCGQSTPGDPETFDPTARELGEGDPFGTDTDDTEDPDARTRLPSVDDFMRIAGEMLQKGADEIAGFDSDAEVVRRIIRHSVEVIWKQVLENQDEDLISKIVAQAAEGDSYASAIAQHFLHEWEATERCPVPADWRFTPAGQTQVALPDTMQRRSATMLRDRRRVGNWSGTGSGKTVGAILGAETIGAKTVIVIAPNNIVDTWVDVIHNCLPNQEVRTHIDETGRRNLRPRFTNNQSRRWLVMNYEALSGKQADTAVEHLLGLNPDLLILDEIHYVKFRSGKQYGDGDESRRRMALKQFVSRAGDHLSVLGMSATPVLNHLSEGVSLVEAITGEDRSDMNTRPTVDNAMGLFFALLGLGQRYIPDYKQRTEPRILHIPAPDLEDEFVSVWRSKHDVSALERVWVPAKIKAAVDECVIAKSEGERVFIYTHYVEGVVNPLREALEAAGLRVGVFTGGDKTGLARFVGKDNTSGETRTMKEHERVDVLIGSSAIGTGTDGLQTACRRTIMFILPWTAGEYQQVIGRIYRRGMMSDTAEVLHLRVYVPGGADDEVRSNWSWDERHWEIIRRKQSLADAAVDGSVPTHLVLTEEKVAEATVRWLERLRGGAAILDPEEQRRQCPMPVLDIPDDAEQVLRQRQRQGDFSRINNRWSSSKSTTTHNRLVDDPTEWRQYHELYREARQHWDIVPAHMIAGWLDKYPPGQVVADLGCGEMILADRCQTKHDIRGFDHVAVDGRVTACDIASVPLPDGSVDIAVLSLALMGTNNEDYIDEAHRILAPGSGQLLLAERTSLIGSDKGRIERALADRGFDMFWFQIVTEGKFVVIRANRRPGTADTKSDYLLSREPVEIAVPPNVTAPLS